MSRSEPERSEAPAVSVAPPSLLARSLPDRLWYDFMRWIGCLWLSIAGGIRATGRENVPSRGGALLVANHSSFLDVFAVGVPLHRHLEYLARSTLFIPILGFLLRHLGGIPIQRDGMGASGLKETLRRVRQGGIVILFPEGTRSRDGRVAELKSGIAVLALKSRVPIIPAGMAGTFEAWPRTQLLPGRHAIRICYGTPIQPAEIAGLTHGAITTLIQERISVCFDEAQRALARDLAIDPACAGGCGSPLDTAPVLFSAGDSG